MGVQATVMLTILVSAFPELLNKVQISLEGCEPIDIEYLAAYAMVLGMVKATLALLPLMTNGSPKLLSSVRDCELRRPDTVPPIETGAGLTLNVIDCEVTPAYVALTLELPLATPKRTPELTLALELEELQVTLVVRF